MITLPWYPRQLNPNVSSHYQEKARHKAIYKEACYWITKESKTKSKDYTELHIRFFKPTRRWMDLDNMLASIKSGLDGMCLALQIDDRCFTKIVIEIDKNIGGMIEIELK